MSSHQIPFRVQLKMEDRILSFLTIFPGRDNSLYFHPARPTGAPWITPRVEDVDGNRHLHFSNPCIREFELNKISFHPSGYIHLTDRNGRRFRDGVRRTEFARADLPHSLASFVPCDPRTLPPASAKPGLNLVINLQDGTRPFYLSFSLCRESNVQPAVKGAYIPHPVFCFFPDLEFGVGMTMWPVGSKDEEMPTWPPFPFFLLRKV